MSDEDLATSTSAPDSAAPASPAPSAPEPSSSPPAEGAPSQAQDTGETHQTLLEAVQSAVPELQKTDQQDDDGQGASPAPTAQQDPTATSEVDDDGSLPDEISQEEMSKYALSAKRRIRKLWNQRRELRDEVQRLRSFEPQVEAATNVEKFLRDNGVSRDDFVLGLDAMGRLARGDLAGFRSVIEPYWNLAEQYLGNQLPQDLQNAVRQGQMTTEAAVQFSRERMERALLLNRHNRAQQTAQQQQQYFQQQQHRQQRESLANAVAAEVNTWERTVMAHDPNYAAKRDAVRNTMWAVVRETGAPESPAHGVQIAREAYRRVNEQYRSWSPPKRPTSRSPSSTGRTTGAAPEAKSMLDVVKHARETFPARA